MIEEQEVRVVSFRAGAFAYRDALDMVASQHPVRLFDFDTDGRPEVVLGGPEAFNLSRKPSAPIAIARWTFEHGFAKSTWHDGK